MKIAIRTALAVIIGLFVFWIMSRADQMPQAPAWLSERLEEARALYEERPLLLLFTFSVAHIFSACLSIPGSCTALNVFSGATFGFWRGCLLVYVITMISAMIGYFAARWLGRLPFMARYSGTIEKIRGKLDKGGFLVLISFRLSPFLPYGVLNLALGLLGVHFWAFVSSTFVGIFFDVVLLNSLGATLALAGTGPAQNGPAMVLAFVALLVVIAIFRKVLSQRLGTGETN